MGSGLNRRSSRPLVVVCIAAAAFAPAALAEVANEDRLEAIERELDDLKRREAERQLRIEELERELERAREEAHEAREVAEAAESAASDTGATAGSDPSQDIWSRDIRNTSVRLMDLGLDVLFAAGTSTADNDQIPILQSGAHDPRQRGFTLQQIELSLQGAVDPYLQAAAYLVFFIDSEGESQFEVEEAFALSQALPFGLDDMGFQIEGGTFFTEFGYLNPRHPHLWTFQDQPFVMSRLLGGDGLRGPGFRIGWLMPLPWFSELHFGMQNAIGETQVSFFANDEVYEERAIGGRPFVSNEVDGGKDLTYLVRWANGFDPSDSWSAAARAVGGVRSGSDGRASAAQLPLWRRPRRQVASRDAGSRLALRGAPGRGHGPFLPGGGLRRDHRRWLAASLPEDWLHDWGLYVEGSWGFRRMWLAGLRYEYGTGGGGASYDGATPIPSDADPYRSTRHRVSPLIVFQPTEFTRLRVQYNYDHDSWLEATTGDAKAHSFWFGFEFGLGRIRPTTTEESRTRATMLRGDRPNGALARALSLCVGGACARRGVARGRDRARPRGSRARGRAGCRGRHLAGARPRGSPLRRGDGRASSARSRAPICSSTPVWISSWAGFLRWCARRATRASSPASEDTSTRRPRFRHSRSRPGQSIVRRATCIRAAIPTTCSTP